MKKITSLTKQKAVQPFLKNSVFSALLGVIALALPASNANALAFTSADFSYVLTVNDIFDTKSGNTEPEPDSFNFMVKTSLPGPYFVTYYVENNAEIKYQTNPENETSAILKKGDIYTFNARIEARADEKNDETSRANFFALALLDVEIKAHNLDDSLTYFVDFTVDYSIRSSSSVQDETIEGARSFASIDVSGPTEEPKQIYAMSSTGRSYDGSPNTDFSSGTSTVNLFVAPNELFEWNFRSFDAAGIAYSTYSTPEPNTLALSSLILLGMLVKRRHSAN